MLIVCIKRIINIIELLYYILKHFLIQFFSWCMNYLYCTAISKNQYVFSLLETCFNHQGVCSSAMLVFNLVRCLCIVGCWCWLLLAFGCFLLIDYCVFLLVLLYQVGYVNLFFDYFQYLVLHHKHKSIQHMTEVQNSKL